jgi:hypothetical protein
MPDGGVRSATLERMTAVSLSGNVREQISCWAVPRSRPGWLTTN